MSGVRGRPDEGGRGRSEIGNRMSVRMETEELELGCGYVFFFLPMSDVRLGRTSGNGAWELGDLIFPDLLGDILRILLTL